MRRCVRFVLPVLLAGAAAAQPAETAPKFDLADVHPTPASPLGALPPLMRGPFVAAGRYELRYASMVDLIALGYNLDHEKVVGGPSWLEQDRFDVFAKVPAQSTPESRRLMMRSLLADRFHLATHEDKKPVTAWALTVGKEPKLKSSDGDGAGGCKFDIENAAKGPPPPGAPIQLPVIVYTCKDTGMDAFAAAIPDIPTAGQFLNNLLVVNRTGIKGSFDFTLRFTPRLPPGIQAIGENIPFTEAVEKQLGLRLELSTAPMPVIAVDRVDRTPTPNSPEALKSFPPLPDQFEVASLKPSPPNPGGGDGPRPNLRNGRLYVPRISVKGLLQIAWVLPGDEFLVNAPKWMDQDKYDLLAKVPEGVAVGELTQRRDGLALNIDALAPMIRSLLVERFQMKTHMEERPLTAYTMVAAKPKLKQSDPNSRTRWQEGALPDARGGKNANPSLGRLVTCQNVSMAQFAQMLPSIAPGYLQTRVVDATGLEGGWDFTFSFSPLGAVQVSNAQRAPSGDSAGSPPEASDPTGATSLFDALAKQLGLKLEQQKTPMQVLVIDHIERTPTEN